MQPAMSETHSQYTGLWYPTNPDERIVVARANSVKDVRPFQLNTTYKDFFASVMEPDRTSTEKMGSLFMMGPCNGTKTKSNIPHLSLAVLDADSSYDEDMNIISGAPDPLEVHKLFKGMGITHAIFTTHSHGAEGKGNRYRVLFPVHCYTEYQLRSVVTYYSELLQKHGKLPFVLTPESFRWNSLWQYPRLRSSSAPFFATTYWGNTLNASEIEKYYDFSNQLASRLPPPTKNDLAEVDEHSLLGQMEKYLPVTAQLRDHGYTFWHQGSQRTSEGKLQLVQRWAKPGETENPGIVVFQINGREFAFSHYSNDPLSTGKAHDAWSAFITLNTLSGLENREKTKIVLDALHQCIAEEMNAKYPSIMLSGSDFKIGNIFDEETGGQSYKYMSFINFQMAMSNQAPVYVLSKKQEDNSEPVLETVTRDVFWKASKLRKLYNGLRYQPCVLGKEPKREIKIGGNIYFNLFRGWNVEPVKGSWDLLSWHLRYSICSGNESEYEYLLDWFAHMVQYPTKKPGVAMVLKGGKGWGKTEVFARLIKAFGPNSMVITHSKQLTGNFNSHLQNKISIIIEESYWSGDPQSEGVLKNIITDEHTTYEAKRENAVEGRSMVRVIMITNNDWAAPVSADERRFFIPTLSSASYDRNQERRNNPRGDFFPQLFLEMDTGGVQAFYYDMLRRDISNRSIYNPPLTEELSKQRMQSMTKEDAWVFDILSSGEIRGQNKQPQYIGEHGLTVRVADVEESMNTYLLHHDKQRSSQNRMRQYLTKLLPKTHRFVNTGNGYYIRFSSLEKCREDYQKHAKVKVTWPDIDESYTL